MIVHTECLTILVLQGLGIIIEKGFQDGGKHLRNRGVRVESLAVIESMNDETGEIVFRK